MPPPLHPWLEPLRERFADLADPEIAAAQERYMRGRFTFFGLKTPARRAAVKAHVQEVGRPSASIVEAVVRSAWQQPQREFHYTGMEVFTAAVKRNPVLEALPLAEELILTHSWWDTVDHLAVHGVGAILAEHPAQMAQVVDRYLASGELWLQRTALIFQLQFGTRTDEALLFRTIVELAPHQDFFIRKGIGWALRQYARTAPAQVRTFLATHTLAPLSVREASRHLV
jgi:3-methyladenine DNA glycosylase AlkD